MLRGQLPNLVVEGLMFAITATMQEPDGPVVCCVNTCFRHGQHRRDAYAIANQHQWSVGVRP
jgi:hypothetical protein